MSEARREAMGDTGASARTKGCQLFVSSVVMLAPVSPIGSRRASLIAAVPRSP